MYSVCVEATFSAVHRLRLPNGTLEPQHGHNWLVRAHFVRPELDENGMVIDFARARLGLESVVAGLNRVDLNRHEGLVGRNPTAEHVAGYVFERMVELGLSTIRRIEVTEAPGYIAGYEATVPVGNAE